MAKKKANEVKGKVVSYDKGKFQLIVEWTGSKKGGFKFRPRVVIKDGFKKSHTAVFQWTDHAKKAKKENTKSGDDNTVFAASQATVKHKRTVQKSTRYAAYEKTKTGTKGKWFTNFDGRVTITCTIGKNNSSVTIDHRNKPFAPEGLSVEKVGGVDEHIQVHVAKVQAKMYQPVRRLRLYRMTDSATEGAYSQIAVKSFGNDDSGGDIDGLTSITFDDQTTSAGHRYKYKVVAENAKGSSSSETDWYWTSPPGVSNVSHSRNAYTNETQNSVRFTRKDEDIDHGYYKGFLLQYSNSLPTDPDSKQIWHTVDKADIKFYDPRYPTVAMPDGFSWLDVKYKPKNSEIPVPVRNDILLRHMNCQKDLPYRYRIIPWNYFAGGRVRKVTKTTTVKQKVPVKYSKKKHGEYTQKYGNNKWGTSGYKQVTKKEYGAVNEVAVYSDDPSPSLAGTEVTYNEPYEPQLVEGVYNPSTGAVDITVTRQQVYTTADKMFIQRKGDGDWEDVPSDSGSEGISIDPKTDPSDSERYDNRQYTFTDYEIPTGTVNAIRYRVSLACSKTPADGTRLEIGNGRSKWKESNDILVVAKPNPPTPVMPVNNSYALIDDGSVRLAWIHSPIDGTPQESAILEYSTGEVGDANTETVTIEDEALYELNIGTFESGTKLKWRVKTKGAHPSYSDWSEVYNLDLYLKPTITWTAPGNGSSISNLPLDLEWNYSDDAGTLERLTLSIIQDGEALSQYDLDTALSSGVGSQRFSDYLFDDNETYQLLLTATSSIGIDCSDRLNIDVKYVSIYLENGYEPDATFNEDTGVVYVTIGKQMSSEEMDTNVIAIDEATSAESAEMAADDQLIPPEATVTTATIVRMYLYRVYNGKKTLLKTLSTADVGTLGDTYEVEDWYAPMNVDYDYQLLQITSEGEVAITEATMNFESLWWYVYYGDGEIVKARWNPSGSATFKRPEKQQIRYSGREYPVTYDSRANEETYSFTTTLFRDLDDGRDVLEQFKNMMKSGGTGVWKSFEGDVYAADFDFSYSSDYTDGLPSWQCSLNVTRIDTEEDL